MRSSVRRSRSGDYLAQRLSAWPRLTFWYGIGPQALARLPNEILREYEQQLPELVAAYQSALLTVAVFPHSTATGQRETIAYLREQMHLAAKEAAYELEHPAPPPDPQAYLNQLAVFGIAGGAETLTGLGMTPAQMPIAGTQASATAPAAPQESDSS